MRKFLRIGLSLNWKKVIIGMVIVSLLTTSALGISGKVQLTANYTGIKLVVDGQSIVPKDAAGNIVEPFIVNGTTYLPVRAIASALGKEVNWDAATQTVYIGSMPPSSAPPPSTPPPTQSGSVTTKKGLNLSTIPFDKDVLVSEIRFTDYGKPFQATWFKGENPVIDFHSVNSHKGKVFCSFRGGLDYSNNWVETFKESWEESANTTYAGDELVATSGAVYDKDTDTLWYCTIGRGMGSYTYFEFDVSGLMVTASADQGKFITAFDFSIHLYGDDDYITLDDLKNLRALLDTSPIGYTRLLPYIKTLADDGGL